MTEPPNTEALRADVRFCDLCGHYEGNCPTGCPNYRRPNTEALLLRFRFFSKAEIEESG